MKKSGNFVDKRRMPSVVTEAGDDSALPRFLSRSGESEAHHFRSGRFVRVGHECFVTLRNGEEIGPFLERWDAEAELVHCIARHFEANPEERAGLYARATEGLNNFEQLVLEVLEFKEALRLRSANAAYVWVIQHLDAEQKYGTADHLRTLVFTRLRDELDHDETDLMGWVG
jgi:hypothetical protein